MPVRVRHRVDLHGDVGPLLRVVLVREVLERLRRRPLEPQEAQLDRLVESWAPRRRRLAPPRRGSSLLVAAACRHGRGERRHRRRGGRLAPPPLVPRCIPLLLGAGYPSRFRSKHYATSCRNLNLLFRVSSLATTTPRLTCPSAGRGCRPRTAHGSTSWTRPPTSHRDRRGRLGRRRRAAVAAARRPPGSGRRRRRATARTLRRGSSRARRADDLAALISARERQGVADASGEVPTRRSSSAGSPRRRSASGASPDRAGRRPILVSPAVRRLRADHAVELPRRDGDPQARAGSGGGCTAFSSPRPRRRSPRC